jgi:hypothetical protein
MAGVWREMAGQLADCAISGSSKARIAHSYQQPLSMAYQQLSLAALP